MHIDAFQKLKGERQTVVGRLGEFVAQEAEAIDDAANRWSMLRHLHKTQQALLEHLMAALEQEYYGERRLIHSPEQRRIDLVRRLLIEDVDPDELRDLDYELDSRWHIGIIAHGAASVETVRCAGNSRKRKLLCVPGVDGTVWVWLGGHTKLTVAELKLLLSTGGPPKASLAIGEPGSGLEGWRVTHEEARMASLIGRHQPCGLTRCGDVLPIASAIQNEAIIHMYQRAYISPLNTLYKGGQPVRKSLLAYFKHGRSTSSAGKAINVTARTIQNHLNEVRNVLDAPLNMTGLEIALRLEELGYMG